MSVYGADVEQLRALARRLGRVADDLDNGQRTLGAQLTAARAWQGPSADRFRSEWATSHTAALRAAAAHLRSASSRIEQDAREQEAASVVDASAGGSRIGAHWAASAALAYSAQPGFKRWLLEQGVSAADTYARYWPRVGRFAPRGADGRFVAIGTNRWHNAWRSMSDRNWVPARGKSLFSGRITRIGSAVAKASVIIDFGLNAVEQWFADADDPGMDPLVRGMRATVAGSSSAAGTLSGALAGAKVGLFAGALIPVPFAGPAIGAFVGGVIGGVVGGNVGSTVGDFLLSDRFQSAAQSAAAGAGRAVETAAKAVTGVVGRGLTEVGKALKFWR